MIISSLSFALKNAIMTAVTAIPVAMTVAFLPASFSIDSFFWGCVGGICRAIAIYEGWKSVAASLIVGGFSAAGLNGTRFPWISEFINSEAGNAQLQPFFIGVCGIIIISAMVDLARKTKIKLGGK